MKLTRKVLPAVVAILISNLSYAGVASVAQFVTPGEFALGLETELTLTNGAGLGGQLKYTHGLTELLNTTGILGTGGGPRQFRVGTNLVFDFFPDIDGQPGIGIATQAIYYRVDETGQVEVTGIPYIHKTFYSGNNEINPFFAFPVGLAFNSGQYQAISTMTIGSTFKNSEHFRYSLEFGIAVNNTESYLSAGVTYFH